MEKGFECSKKELTARTPLIYVEELSKIPRSRNDSRHWREFLDLSDSLHKIS